MTADPQLSSRLAEVIRAYVDNRIRSQPISVARLARAARAFMPSAAMADHELLDFIIRELVLAGANVDFDRRGFDPAKAPAFHPVVANPSQSIITREHMPLSMRRRRPRKGRPTYL